MSSNNPRHIRHSSYSRPIAVAQIPPGADFSMDFNNVPDVKAGRVGHIAWLSIRVAMLVTTVAASMAEAASWRRGLARVLRNIKLEAAGHAFLSNLDGEDVLIWSEALLGQASPLVPSGTILADADATGTAIELHLLFPFVAPPAAKGEAHEDRILPLALFKGSNPGQLTFQVNPTPVPGVTVTSVTSCTVNLGLTYRDRYLMPTPYEVRAYEEAELYHTIAAKGAIDHLVVCTRATTAAAASHDDYRLRSLTVGGEEVLLNPDASPGTYEGAQLAHYIGQGQDLSELSDATRFTLLSPNPLDRRVSKMTRGDLRFEFSARPSGFTKDRMLRVDTGIHTDAWAEAYRTALGAAAGSVVYRSRAETDTLLAPLIAQELVFAGSPGAIVASKAARA